MPEICRFYGIVIKMFFKPKEHEPSHLHALYGEHVGIFDLQTMEMTEGDLPKRPGSWSPNGCGRTKTVFWRCGERRGWKNCRRCPERSDDMIPRIKELFPMRDFLLRVVFDDGKTVLYDVKEDMEQIPAYQDLRLIRGLFDQVQLDQSRTCVFWNEEIDLPSDTIYEYGAVQS